MQPRIRSSIAASAAVALCTLAATAQVHRAGAPSTAQPTARSAALLPPVVCTPSCPPPTTCAAGTLRTVCFEAVFPATPVSPICSPDFAPANWDTEFSSPPVIVPPLTLPRFDPAAFPGCAQLLQAELSFEGSFEGSITLRNNSTTSSCTLNVLATVEFRFKNHALFAAPCAVVSSFGQNVSLPSGGTAQVLVPTTTGICPDSALGQPPLCFTSPSILASVFLASPGNATFAIDHSTDEGLVYGACPQLTVVSRSCARVVARVLYTYCEGNVPITSFCAGDGVDALVTTPCPCSNFGAPGHGCANSTHANGAELSTIGCSTSIPETLVLVARELSGSTPAVFFAGDQTLSGGVPFFDGVRCVDGTLTRLGTNPTSGGTASYPLPGQPSVSVRGNTPVGSGLVGSYQVGYRNSATAFCPPATANITNGCRIVW
ncbi:MAG: choice-of-anchor E domain-containing protein [Planctomycetota bacterium]